MNQIVVSVIINTRNRIELLKRAVQSVYSQTYKNIEVIVVDDASDDGTQEYCKTQDFKYIRIDKTDSKGGNYARNIGLQNANGEFIAFCDDDDYWLPSKIEDELDLIIQTQVDFVHCGRIMEIIGSDGIRFEDKLPFENTKGDISKLVFQDIPCVTSTILFRKSALDAVGGFDENLKAWQEHELIIRLSQTSETAFVNKPLVVYRVDTSDSQRITNKYWQWKKAVGYIRKKHSGLISNLSFKDRLRFRRLVASDGIGRAAASGLKSEWYLNRIIVKTLSWL